MRKIISKTCETSPRLLETEIAIECKGLSFSYTQDPFFQNIHLQVQSKSFVAIFGPNGGGKTTFINLLLGFLKPSQGEIRLLGQDPLKSRQHVGYVPQTSELDPQYPISVQEVVKTGLLKTGNWLRGGKEAEKKMDNALFEVGLSHKKNSNFGSLSGGETQRALIARAIVDNPSILILDEPTSSLDIESEKQIISLLKKLQEKMTILMVTHDLGSILSSADRLLCIHKEVCEMGKDAVCQHYGLGLYHTPMSRS